MRVHLYFHFIKADNIMDYRLEIPLFIYFVTNIIIYIVLIKVVRLCSKDENEMTKSFQRLLETVTDILKALEKAGIKVERNKRNNKK